MDTKTIIMGVAYSLLVKVAESASYKTTPETLANSHCSLGMRPRQDYTHRGMLNDCVSARWSPMCQYSALTLFGDSHPLATRHSRESERH